MEYTSSEDERQALLALTVKTDISSNSENSDSDDKVSSKYNELNKK